MRRSAILAIAALALALALPGRARAASFDCARARSPAERLICADPALSALDERLAAAYRAALAAVPWQVRLRGAQADWLRDTRDAAAGDAAAMAAAYRVRTEALEAETRMARDPAFAETSIGQARRSCLPLPPGPERPLGEDRACRVREAGGIGTADGRVLRYALYEYPDPAEPDSPVLAEVATVVFAETAPGRVSVTLVDIPGMVACGAPRLVAAERGTLLHLPCSQHGTGVFNAESVYAWGGGKDGTSWRPLDVESWTHELGRRLPRGYGAWKGIFPDYAALAAVTPLWRDGDANCCPTGGRAEIRLGWQGDRLVLRDLRVRLGAREVPR